MRAHNDFLAPDRPLVTRMRAPIPDIKYNLPPYEWAEYPKMALKSAKIEDIEFYKNMYENFDERIGKARYTQKVPKLGALIALRDDVGNIVVFEDADEEEAFYAEHPEIDRIRLQAGQTAPQISDSELEEFRAWKAAQAKAKNALQAAGQHMGGEEEELRGKLTAAGVEIDGRWGLKRLRDEVAKLD